MKVRLALGIVVLVVAIAGITAPPAQAHVMDRYSHDSSQCEFLNRPTQTCEVNSTHNVWSDPANFCTGASGSITSCQVWHYCWLSGSGGPFMNASLACNFATPGLLSCVQPAVGNCNGGVTYGSTVIAVNTCVDFRVDVQASASIGTTAYSDVMTVCVDRYGAY